jgi:glutamyl-Q tRNA(Asp) synthetase
LGLPEPRYLHTPLVLGADGHKLSKQNGAQALNLPDAAAALAALRTAGAVLGLPDLPARRLPDWLAAAVRAWAGIMPPLAT